MAPVRLGIAGFGRLARQYYGPALRTLGGIQVLVADPLEASRQAARRALPRASVFADPAELLAQRPDGIIIATPPSSHLALWRAATRAGIPMLMEKPFVLRGELAEATGTPREQRLLMIDFNRRFWGPYRRIAELVRSGAMGPVVGAELTLEVDVRPWCTVTGHRLDPAEGGALYDLGSQMVDLACWLLDREPAAVQAVARAGGGRPTRCGSTWFFRGRWWRGAASATVSARESDSRSRASAAESGWPIPTWSCTSSAAARPRGWRRSPTWPCSAGAGCSARGPCLGGASRSRSPRSSTASAVGGVLAGVRGRGQECPAAGCRGEVDGAGQGRRARNRRRAGRPWLSGPRLGSR